VNSRQRDPPLQQESATHQRISLPRNLREEETPCSVITAKELDKPWISVTNYMVIQAISKEVEEGFSREPTMFGEIIKTLRLSLLLLAILPPMFLCQASIKSNPSSCCSFSLI